jgi:uridine kinase
MDDFFLRPQQRTPQRLKEVGGNVDYERFSDEVIAGLGCGREFSYRKFDCSLQALGGEITVKPKKLNIIEGSYSMHPKLIEAYDLKILLQIDEREQKERILKRSGKTMLERFINEWIPLEDAYLKAFGIKEKSGIVYASVNANAENVSHGIITE